MNTDCPDYADYTPLYTPPSPNCPVSGPAAGGGAGGGGAGSAGAAGNGTGNGASSGGDFGITQTNYYKTPPAPLDPVFITAPTSRPTAPPAMATTTDGGMEMSVGWSSQPVRYFDGLPKTASTDLSSSGYGMPWGVTRTWTGLNGGTGAGQFGNGWAVSELPYAIWWDGLDRGFDPTVAVVDAGGSQRLFDGTPSAGLTARDFIKDTLSDAGSGELVLTDTSGNQTRFYTIGESPGGLDARPRSGG